MNILMTGGTGFLGSALRSRLSESGHTITCISRSRQGVEGSTTFVKNEDLPKLGPHEGVINLAGESVVGLWTPAKRKTIYDSRVSTTKEIAAWIEQSTPKPKVFLSGSAVGIYGDAEDRLLTEKTDVARVEGFLAKVCRDWEHAASSAAWRGTRTVLLRTGQVLDPSGGFLKKALPLFRRLPIVILGPRSSFFPWVALDDWVGAAMHALENKSVAGPMNLVSPNPVTQEEFAHSISKTLGKKVRGRVPRWALKLGAGEFGESITFSQRAVPEVALASGFTFDQPNLDIFLATVVPHTPRSS